MSTTLAEIENFGKIYRCGNCDSIHLQIGPMNVALSVDGYMQLVALLNTSAANFERTVDWSGADHHEQRG